MAAEDDSEEYLDPNTYSNYKEVAVVHTDIEWNINFDTKTLSGSVTHTLRRLNNQATMLLLDTNDLEIKSISHWTEQLAFTLSPRVDADPTAFGRCLNIDLESVKFVDTRDDEEKKSNPNEINETAQIKIEYITSSSAEAIQWLDASITDGGKLPYLFTQCQPIGARTMLPCQDTPGSKFTYSAIIKTPKKLSNGQDSLFTAMMSAPTSNDYLSVDNNSDANWTIHKITQPRKIPSYLLALVVGDIEQQIVGDLQICSVITEPCNMKADKWEFENMQSYLTIAESICGKYRWASYACLVLPSSFPYGGMENPNITFVTPTLIAGDRSLVNVVAHEITHSWSGNLVTNESWEHFWLNEGWTRYIEMKIMERKVTIDKEAEKLGIVNESEKFTRIKYDEISAESIAYGVRYHALQVLNGRTALQGSVDRFGKKHEEYTKLWTNLKNTDPDEVYSSVPYEKGADLILLIEDIVGGPSSFAPFIKAYFDKFAEQSIGYDAFRTFLFEYYDNNDAKISELLKNKIDWAAWIWGVGMSPVDVVETLKSRANKLGVDNLFELIEQVDKLVNTWTNMKDDMKECDENDIINGMNGWSVDQKEMFLDKMLENIRKQTKNNEVTLEIQRKKLGKMNEIYGLYKKAEGNNNDANANNSSNAEEKDNGDNGGKAVGNREILFRFFLLVLECEEESLYQDVVTQMLACVGRMKYVRPLYRALASKNLALAEESFEKYKDTQYHPIGRKMVQKDLSDCKLNPKSNVGGI